MEYFSTDPRYPNMKFKAWEFQEFPKYIGRKDGKDFIARDPEHEQELRRMFGETPAPVPPPVLSVGKK